MLFNFDSVSVCICQKENVVAFAKTWTFPILQTYLSPFFSGATRSIKVDIQPAKSITVRKVALIHHFLRVKPNDSSD